MESATQAGPHAGMPVSIRAARADDAFAVAALHLQRARELGGSGEAGFLEQFADAWLADRARVTLLAHAADGRPLGVVHGALVRTMPAPGTPGSTWLALETVYVTADARGCGVGVGLLRRLLEWCHAHAVARVTVVTEGEGAGLYERVGFARSSQALWEIVPGR